MIATIACLSAIAGQHMVGQKWHYVLTWHFTNKEINTTDEESFDVKVTKVFPESTTVTVSQLLIATLFDGQRIPTDPKTLPASHDWALSSNGSVAYMPNARFGLETRVYRILKGIMPAAKGDPDRDKAWTIEYPDDGLGMPQSRLKGLFTKADKDSKEFSLIYRERQGTQGVGRFIRTNNIPCPTLLEVKFMNTKMQGGNDLVDCDFVMKLKTEK